MAVVQEDRKGVFVRVGGHIARPLTPENRPPRAAGYPNVETVHRPGDRVRARHQDSSIATVGGEMWFMFEAADDYNHRRKLAARTWAVHDQKKRG